MLIAVIIIVGVPLLVIGLLIAHALYVRRCFYAITINHGPPKE